MASCFSKKTWPAVLAYVAVVILITEGSAMLEEFMIVLFVDSSVSERMRIVASYLVGGAILIACAAVVDWLDNRYSPIDGPHVIAMFTRSTLLPFTLPRISVDVSLLRLVVLVGALQLSQAFYNYGHFLAFKDWAEENRVFMLVSSLLVWFGGLVIAAYISYRIIPGLNKHHPVDHASSGLFASVDPTHKVVRVVGENVPL